ncbi:tRNA pseudouridine(13) synthase TruD [Halocatena halophila]|uniref:tRNA pseudouridine(13) synthase TruD n=1 Tax=Halocatena halophila TaxID=2814576 RepID=UPI002ED09FA7
MTASPPFERAIGIDRYVSETPGIDGVLRNEPADFAVRERSVRELEPLDADPGDYPALVFRATLTNRDTNGFASELANRLGISRERITWAGTKDKRAVTTQRFSIRNFQRDSLPSVAGAEIELLGRAGRPVLFGDHNGNEFSIIVREATENARELCEQTTTELASFADRTPPTIGVANVFGPQRFGTIRPVTHEVGLAIVRGNFEQAVLTYLGNPSPTEPPATRRAREYVDETHDWAGALDRFPSHLGYERAIAQRLLETDATGSERFETALTAVPSNLQALFVHAAQSYLFNQLCSRRLEAGLPFDRPVAGDVVCFTDDHGRPDPDHTQRVTKARVKTITRHCERGRAFVTAPLVGTETELGEKTPGDIERAVLDDEGLTPGSFDGTGQFGSTGTRRPILLQTAVSIDAVDDDPTALSFEFSLPNGAYATVVLREYMKVPAADLA